MNRVPLLAAAAIGLGGAAPAGPAALTPIHRIHLRCAAAFALAADEDRRHPQAPRQWPVLGASARAYFAGAAAEAMDDAGLSREAVSADIVHEAQAIRARAAARGDYRATLAEEVTPCLPGLETLAPPAAAR